MTRRITKLERNLSPETIEKILKLRAKGRSYRQLADWINENANIGEDINHMTVKSFLDNAPPIDVDFISDANEEREHIKTELWKIYNELNCKKDKSRTASLRIKALMELGRLIDDTTAGPSETSENPVSRAEQIEKMVSKLAKGGNIYANPTTGKISEHREMPHLKKDDNDK